MKFVLPTIKIKIEKWKFNKEYKVWVSTEGNFKNKHRQPSRLLVNNSGYIAIETCKGLRTAHRLVLKTWRPTLNMDALTVDHKNHNKRDNRLCNLEWVTQEENVIRAEQDLAPQVRPQQQELQLTVIAPNATFSIGDTVTFAGTSNAIGRTAYMLKARLGRDFSCKIFTKHCRGILDGKIPQGSKKYYGFEIKERR